MVFRHQNRPPEIAAVLSLKYPAVAALTGFTQGTAGRRAGVSPRVRDGPGPPLPARPWPSCASLAVAPFRLYADDGFTPGRLGPRECSGDGRFSRESGPDPLIELRSEAPGARN